MKNIMKHFFATLTTVVLGQVAMAQTATNNCGYNAGNEYPVGTSCNLLTFNKTDAFTSNLTASGCTGGNYDDAWGWFTAASNYVNLTFDPANNHRPILHLYTGACGSLTQVGCVNSGGNGNNANLSIEVIQGQNYMVRIQRHNDNAAMNGSFCAWRPAFPSNDEPCSATSLTVNTTCSSTAGTNRGASNTTSVAAPPCGNYQGGDVWYSFVAPASGQTVIQTSANGLTDSGIALYSAATCSTAFSLITCATGGNGAMGQITQSGLTPGQTYYVRVWGEGNASGTFDICVGNLTNDEPCDATNLTLGTTCNYTAYANAFATISNGIPAPGCGNANHNDVWFRFTAPSNGLATFRVTTGTLANPQFAVYKASSCNGPFILVKCDNTSGPGNAPFMTLTPLEIIPGETYYLRVWGNNGSTGTFNLCAFTAPSTGNCIYVLRMWDSQGDGWGNSRVTIQVGASPAVQYWNANADEDVAYIPVSIGQNVTLSYATGGSGGQGEIRYALQLINGPLYMDGPTPGTGPRWAGTSNCQSATPLSSDCAGGAAICNAQQLNASPSNTGLMSDMNLHNRGCLSNNERQGVWYRYTISQSGTLGFTITPQNNSDDYDFAVWGPYSSSACPPEELPFRCNYSGTTGATGVSSLGTNPSEPAGGSKWSSLMPVTVGQIYMLYVSNWSQSGLAFDLTWQLTNGASLDCSLLPIQLLSLNGAPVPEGIRLDWSTATESNSAAFAIERMNEFGDFVQIGELPAAGNSNSLIEYQFIDYQPMQGFNHYRLKMIDADGSAELSQVVSVANRYGGFVGLYPNPATDHISIVMDELPESEIIIRFHDASGRLVREERTTVAEGQSLVKVPLLGLDPGHYALSYSFQNSAMRYGGRFLVQ